MVMTDTLAMPAQDAVAIEIAGIPICLRTADISFQRMLRRRYGAFVTGSRGRQFEFDIDICDPRKPVSPHTELTVSARSGEWLLQRGDFRARWNPDTGRGQIRQSYNPYAIDSILRIVHGLIQAKRGGFLLHAASAIRNGKAFLFSGVSGAGKTTISRLAPPDASLLTDEISYVRRNADRPDGGFRNGNQYVACGTPFAGELARLGENVSAPLSAVYLLEKGPENRIDPIPQAEAIRRILRNILFFANDPALVELVFQSAWEFVNTVPIQRLTFVPDARVWDLIG
jgi:hypothetical protein